MKNPPHSKPYFGLFWPLKLIKTLFTYFNHKIKPKPSIDGTLSPNTIFFSEGLYCTVIFRLVSLKAILFSNSVCMIFAIIWDLNPPHINFTWIQAKFWYRTPPSSFTTLSSKPKECSQNYSNSGQNYSRSGQITVMKLSQKGDVENPKVLNTTFSNKSVPE